MPKLVRRKIHEKKPGYKIKQKIPMKSKTPTGTEESFELPPPKKRIKLKVPKTTVQPPSRHGLREEQKSDTSQVNISPPISDRRGNRLETSSKPISSPMIEKDQRIVKSESPPKSHSQQEKTHSLPSTHGILPKGVRKKDSLNRPLPSPEHLEKKRETPHSTGSSSKKKFANISLPRIKSKKPKNSDTKIIPSSKGVVKKKQYRVINRPIPKEIREKKPSKKKLKPPPTLKDEIPKTRIKSKKPG
jgi:hypothetical protein